MPRPRGRRLLSPTDGLRQLPRHPGLEQPIVGRAGRAVRVRHRPPHLLVFGARTGAGAAAYARGQSASPYVDPAQVQRAARELGAPLERPEGEDPYAIQRDLQATMQSLVGIFREESDLARALDRLDDLEGRWSRTKVDGGRVFNPGWNLVFELRNLIIVSEAIARSALQRQESRGAHSRLDYPNGDDEHWGHRNSMISIEDGEMCVNVSPLPEMPAELAGLLGGA